MKLGIRLAEKGWLPDALLRMGIRRLLEDRLRETRHASAQDQQKLVEALRQSPIAINVAAANEQHYEVPAELFVHMLGPRMKYSSCYWPDLTTTLAEAETAMLELTTKRAEVSDGMRILELGCGWGSLCLWLADRFPRCQLLAVSNSASQRRHIKQICRERQITNLQVVTADINQFNPADHGWKNGSIDRVVSVEMFEHLRNYEAIFARIRQWLNREGKLFLHVFCHRERAYPFEDRGDDDWMARHFFTGGMMPSFDLFRRFDRDLHVTEQWWISGDHYERTLRAWLAQVDERSSAILPILASTYGAAETQRWLNRWRIFLLACAELFGYRDGTEWGVGHYLLAPIGR